MANNNTIQILRGENIKSTAGSTVLLPGQPCYDMSTGYLYVGDNSSISSTDAVKASYANEAGHADSADTASNATYATNAGRASTANNVAGYLYLNNGTSSVMWDGDENTTIYVPRTKGSSGQVWGMNGSNVGWINQTEVPGTIEHANTADSADYATSAGSATTANKTKYSLYLNNGPSNVAWNGSASNVIYVPTSRGANGQVWSTTATGVGWVTPTSDLSDTLYGRHVALNNSASYQFTRQSTMAGTPNAYYELPYVSGTSSTNPATIATFDMVNRFMSPTVYNYQISVDPSDEDTGIPWVAINNYTFIIFNVRVNGVKSGFRSIGSQIFPAESFHDSNYGPTSGYLYFSSHERWASFYCSGVSNLSLNNLRWGGVSSSDAQDTTNGMFVSISLLGNKNQL